MSGRQKRKDYLENVWKKAFPESLGYAHRGRIHIISKEEDALELEDGTSKIISSDLSEILLVGDIVGIKPDGTIELLVPSLGENPFKNLEFDQKRAVQWQSFLEAVRGFFKSEKFLELRTPTLVPSPGLEPFLDPFETRFDLGSKSRKFFLPTSPEFHLKKALCLGYEKIFEFKECFRNGELSEHHQPEFLMLEWYRAYSNAPSLIDDIKALLPYLNENLKLGHSTSLTIILMEDLWEKALGFRLTPQTMQRELFALAKKLKINCDSNEDFDDLFARIFIEKLEPALAAIDGPVIVHHYPPSQAALARLTSDGWADRFELYWKGFEIANAFHELNDVHEQKRRFTQDQEKKKSLGKKIVPVDEELIKALEWGMPPSAGIALGLERLFMALFDIKEIKAARLFPL